MLARLPKSLLIAITAALALGFAVTLRAAAEKGESAKAEPHHEVAQPDDAAAAAAFESLVPALRHPRCMNCHSVGDYPRQGDDSHRHTMQIWRGPDGEGINAVKCSTCHQDYNLVGLRMPPEPDLEHI